MNLILDFIIDAAILFGVGSFFGIIVGLLIIYNQKQKYSKKEKE